VEKAEKELPPIGHVRDRRGDRTAERRVLRFIVSDVEGVVLRLKIGAFMSLLVSCEMSSERLDNAKKGGLRTDIRLG
jgi:hypothetical protein